MSAAIDRMAAEAMVRLQAGIALASARARVAIHFQAHAIHEAAERRHLQARIDRLRHVRLRDMTDRQVLQELGLRHLLSTATPGTYRTRTGRWLYEISELDSAQDDPLPLPVLFLGGLAVVMALGWLGPAIDAEPDRRAEWLQTERELQAEGTLQLWEQEARTRCAALTGENGAYVLVDGGAIVCTDKRGRRVGRPL